MQRTCSGMRISLINAMRTDKVPISSFAHSHTPNCSKMRKIAIYEWLCDIDCARWKFVNKKNRKMSETQTQPQCFFRCIFSLSGNMPRKQSILCTLWGVPRIVCYEICIEAMYGFEPMCEHMRLIRFIPRWYISQCRFHSVCSNRRSYRLFARLTSCTFAMGIQERLI